MPADHLARVGSLFVLVLALAVAGCDGTSNGGDGDDAGGNRPARGRLLASPPALVRTISAGNLLNDLSQPARQAVLLQAGSPVCDVALHKITYTTVGGKDEDTTASGALMIPTGGNAKCSGARPVLLYAHGTTTNHDFDLTILGQEDAEGLYLAAFFAGQGYIVVAPNYAGYDTSTLPYHPYLVGDQQSKDMIDALAAARSALPTSAAPGTTDAGRLYITGYSQGGYVAMATHRAMEAAGMTVSASAPLSGPYALGAFADAVVSGRVMNGAVGLITLVLNAYQNSYGNVYSSPSDVFESAYASGIASQPFSGGTLPGALFDSAPPDPSFADVTPATTPATLASVFARGFGSDHLITNSFRLSYLRDAQASPDGGWPNTTTAEPPASPGLPWRQALKRNDLRNWTPRAPTLLCGGHDDPTVFWLNTQMMQAYWASHSPGAPYTILDVDAASSGSDDPYADTRREFGLAKDIARATQGEDGLLDVYHGLVAPFCLEAARSFFARVEA